MATATSEQMGTTTATVKDVATVSSGYGQVTTRHDTIRLTFVNEEGVGHAYFASSPVGAYRVGDTVKASYYRLSSNGIPTTLSITGLHLTFVGRLRALFNLIVHPA